MPTNNFLLTFHRLSPGKSTRCRWVTVCDSVSSYSRCSRKETYPYPNAVFSNRTQFCQSVASCLNACRM